MFAAIRWPLSFGLIPQGIRIPEGTLTAKGSRTSAPACRASSPLARTMALGRSSIALFVGAARPHTPRLPPLPGEADADRKPPRPAGLLHPPTINEREETTTEIERKIRQQRKERYSFKLALQRKVSSRNWPILFDNFCHGNGLCSLAGARHGCRRDSAGRTWAGRLSGGVFGLLWAV